MTLQTYELDKKMLEYSISQFRNIPEYVKLCEAFCVGANTIQDTINYLSDTTNVDKAEGIWLDYLGWLVGVKRSAVSDIGDFFSVNSEDLNVEKYFWFPTSSQESSGTNLQDEYYRSLIKAKIGYNTSRCTHEENIKNIKNMTFADHCVLHKAREYDNFSTVGSPTISDEGVASGFSSSKYLYSTETLDCTKPFKVMFNEKRGTATRFNGFGLGTSSNRAYPLFFIQASNTTKITLGLYLNGSLTLKEYNFAHSNYTNINYIVSWDGLNYNFIIENTHNHQIVLNKIVESSTILKRNNTSIGVLVYGYNFNSGNSIQATDLNKTFMIENDILIYRPYTEIPMTMDITLYGDNILNITNLRQQIETFLGDGVGIKNLEIKGLDEYE